MTKDKKTNLLKGAMFAALLSVAASFPASAKEERTPVGHITLNFNADVQAGDTDATISVSVEDGNCSVEVPILSMSRNTGPAGKSQR